MGKMKAKKTAPSLGLFGKNVIGCLQFESARGAENATIKSKLVDLPRIHEATP
jgi:hypothetical protein